LGAWLLGGGGGGKSAEGWGDRKGEENKKEPGQLRQLGKNRVKGGGGKEWDKGVEKGGKELPT